MVLAKLSAPPPLSQSVFHLVAAPVRGLRMTSFSSDLVTVGGCHLRMIAVAVRNFLDGVGNGQVSGVDRSIVEKAAAGSYGSSAAGHLQRELSFGQHMAQLRQWQQSVRYEGWTINESVGKGSRRARDRVAGTSAAPSGEVRPLA
jgi:hypothetical protein